MISNVAIANDNGFSPKKVGEIKRSLEAKLLPSLEESLKRTHKKRKSP